MLVVGHRVHAVEGMRHVDESALLADRRDRLGHAHPARDLLLDEQADHLALLGRLDLLADDHLHAVAGRLRRAPRARPRSRCGRSRRSLRGRVRGRSRAAPRRGWRSPASGPCACAGPRRSAAAPASAPRSSVAVAARVAARGQLGVDRSSRSPRPRRRRRSGGSRRGSARSISSAVAAVLAMRASRRPKKLSTKRRASSVESSRSAEEWNEPTFSAREWRSAAFDVLGANGSCTWTKSSSTVPSSSSTVRATSIGSAAGRRRALGYDVEHLADGDHPRVPVVRAGQQRARVAARGAQRAARVAHALLRARGRDDQHAMAAPRELAGDARARGR